jgi:hypothetical protein
MEPKTIWKFPLENMLGGSRLQAQMPQDARILTVQVQDDTPHLWAEAYPDNPLETRRFAVVGTGQPVPPGAIYIGTWQEAPFVWHLYEGPNNG